MRFISELRRRKVIQTALIYFAASWVLLQVAALLLEMLAVPPWGLRLVFVVLVVGFPLALILSWMHQITPQGLRREPEFPALEAAAGRSVSDVAGNRRSSESRTPDAVAVDDHSIAVLPFANMSEDNANAYFADGLSEELLNLLSRIQGLRVIARTSSFAFKGRHVGAATIARELNVAHLLEGSVRKAGNRIRITAQLIRATDSSHVWSQSFDRDLSDIFAVQDEIAAAVVDELAIKLLGRAAPKSRPTDPQAYALYLQARHFLGLASAPGYEQAITAIESALAIDPAFGPAWSVLCAVYWGEANNALIGYEEGARKARAAADKALALDPQLPEPLSLLGFLDVLEAVDVDRGLRRLERALQLEPYNPPILVRAANTAIRRGRLDEALRYGERALRADPLSPVAHAMQGTSCYFAGRLDEAEALRRKVLALSPGWLSGQFNLGKVLLARNDAVAALAAFEQEPSSFWRLTGLALAHHALGHAAESDAALQELRAQDLGGSAYQLAEIQAFRGEAAAAFECLEHAVETHDAGLSYAAVDPLLRSLHGDSRWSTFLADNGLTG
jgi:TolB-like protein/Flp pilus assembly protein TadD